MASIRQKNLFLIMFWCIGILLIFFSQAEGYQCSSEPTDDLIKYGDTVTCKIEPVGDIDKFRFQGSNGDQIVLQASYQSGAATGPCIELFDPDGVLVDTKKCGGYFARIDTDLVMTGEYTILVTENGNNAAMGYGLALERIVPHSASATPINPGETLSDAITPVGDMDLFFFQGSNGDQIVLQASYQSGAATGPCIELFDPDGVLVDTKKCGGYFARIDTDLVMTGEYTILVTENGNNAAMGYGLALERIVPHSASATPINPGETLSDAITPVGDMDLFFFQGSNGDQIVLQASYQSGGATGPCIELFDPDGVLVDTKCGGYFARIDTDLVMTGEYTILVTENGNNAAMGYGLALERIVPHSASATPINPGETLSDAITPVGDMDLFFFQGSNGDQIVLQASYQSGAATGPCIELFDPDGVLVDTKCGGYFARIDTDLVMTGEYTILVTENGNNAAMGYGLSYQCVGNCPNIPVTFLYTPVTPCRIVDTRKAGGAISAGGIRSYNVRGAVASQGGNSAGCPSPKGEPRAVDINVTAVPLGSGNIVAYPFGSATPTASLVNYRSDAQNVANSGTIKTCFNCGKDINIKSNGGTTHVVIDVQGYFYAAP